MYEQVRREEKEESYSNPIPRSLKIVVILLGLLFIVISVIMNVYMREGLFINGVNFIDNYQESQNIGFVKVVMNLLSLFCHPVTVALVLILEYMLSKRRIVTLVHITYFLFATFFMAVLKQAYQQSRPIWYNNKIQLFQWFCPHDFGHPSGHSFAVFPLYQPILADFFGMGAGRHRFIFLILLGALVPLSRMYLGVHSANQIVQGLTLGLCFATMFRYFYQQIITRFYWFVFTKKRCETLISIILFNIALGSIPILVFAINEHNRPMQENDINNLNLRCDDNKTGIDIQQSMLKKCVLVNFVFGCIYGLFILVNDRNNRLYLWGRWIHKQNMTMLLHFLTVLIAAGVPALIFMFALTIVIPIGIVDYIMMSIGAILAGIGLVWGVKFVARKYQWFDYDQKHQ